MSSPTPNYGTLVRKITSIIGTRIEDAESGKILGKAFIFPWRGKVHLIGYTGERPLRLVAVPSNRVNYWNMSIGFAAAKEPDYPRETSKC